VTLRFNGKPERLRIPFAAVISFADPSVNFGLQLKMAGEPEGEIELNTLAAQNFDLDKADLNIEQDLPPSTGGKGTGEVIALDAFRKKN
jgi:hypothetical protein